MTTGETALLPCAHCGADMMMREHTAFHPENDCWLSKYELDEWDYATWNTRAPPPLQDARERAEKLVKDWDLNPEQYFNESRPMLVDAIATALTEAARMPDGYVLVPKEPTDGTLMSMALRADHGLGCPGYYDQPMTATPGVTHARRLEVAISEARRQYEEVVGAGFYKPEREAEYRAMLTALRSAPTQEG